MTSESLTSETAVTPAGSAGPPPAEDPRSFEQLMDELETITERLAGGDLGIEAATDLYEQAERLHALASDRLTQVQARVERLRSAAGDPPSGPNR
jgi:exodeoxyribonuclease VII small subunit